MAKALKTFLFMWYSRMLGCLCGLLFVSAVSAAEMDFILFPEVATAYERGGDPLFNELDPKLDFFARGSAGRFRFLGEFYWSQDEHHFERLQFGVAATSTTNFWLGRFHTPLGYWHTQYHHGNYLQTSISRPAITDFGADSGPLGSHLSGLLVESSLPVGEISSLDIGFGVGLGGRLISAEGGHGHGHSVGLAIHDLDIADADPGAHETNAALRLAYRPDHLGPHEYGLFLLHAVYPVEDQHLHEVTLKAAGLFANWESDPYRLIAGITLVSDEVSGMNEREAGSFGAGYVQGEYIASPRWILYGRLEASSSTGGDPYLALRPQFSTHRQIAGLRFDATRRQAIKLELSRAAERSQHAETVQLNWTAAFP